MTNDTTIAAESAAVPDHRAILTRYSPEGTLRKATVVANFAGGKRGYVYPFDQGRTAAENHREAARAHALELGLGAVHLVGGTLPNGDWAFVVVPQHRAAHALGEVTIATRNEA